MWALPFVTDPATHSVAATLIRLSLDSDADGDVTSVIPEFHPFLERGASAAMDENNCGKPVRGILRLRRCIGFGRKAEPRENPSFPPLPRKTLVKNRGEPSVRLKAFGHVGFWRLSKFAKFFNLPTKLFKVLGAKRGKELWR